MLAGFYSERLSFAFPPAFMREARFRVAAEWQPADMCAVSDLIAAGRLSLDGPGDAPRPGPPTPADAYTAPPLPIPAA